MLILALLVASSATAQVTVHAFVDKTELGDAETLAYTLEVSGDLDDLAPIQPPEGRGLALRQGTPVHQERLILNGQERLRLTWAYTPQRTGDVAVLGTNVRVKDRTYRTDPVFVTVVPQQQRRAPVAPPTGRPSPPSTASGDLFVRAEPSTRRVVPGQQIIVNYVLYAAPHIHPRRSQVAGTWDAEGFWREELDVAPNATYPRRVTIGGQPYDAVTIRRLALFPTRTGALEVGAMTFEIEVARSTRNANPFDSFFYPLGSRFTEEEVTAPALALTANLLPDDAPEGFNGAVGQFGMAAFMDRDQVTAGEPVRLTVELSGTGNIATLAAPDVAIPPTFERFDPQQNREVDRGATPLRGTKTFTYTFVPRGGGDFEIPPVVWSYYDPAAGRYQTRRSAAFPLTVTGAAAPAAIASETVPVDPSIPLGLMTDATWRRTSSPAAIPLGVVLVGLGLPLLALLGLVAARRRRDRKGELSPERRALRAHPEAKRRLHDAQTALGDAPAFYAALEQALRAFLADRLAIPAQGLSQLALDEALAAHGLSAATRAETRALLATAEQAQFAPGLAGNGETQQADAARAAHLFAAIDAEARQPVGA
ncbi:MAG: protein BatD [Rhodothermaceae bacterium]|nr:protein BatD [Rhodothermaceae bacterium]